MAISRQVPASIIQPGQKSPWGEAGLPDSGRDSRSQCGVQGGLRVGEVKGEWGGGGDWFQKKPVGCMPPTELVARIFIQWLTRLNPGIYDTRY